MKTKATITMLAASMAMLAMATLPSCSDDDNDAPGAKEGEYTVTLEMSYTLNNASSGLDGVDIGVSGSDDDNIPVTKDPGETWSETVTQTVMANGVVGFATYPRITESIKDGEEVTVDYTARCKATVKLDGNVVDSDMYDVTASYTLDYDSELNLVDGFMFRVSADGDLTRINIDDELKGDTDEPDTEQQPVTDDDEVMAKGTLHYYSHADDATNDNHLFDNFVARFPTRMQWDGQPLSKGHYLFLLGNDIEKTPLKVVKESLDNGAIMVIDALDSYATFKRFCETLDIFNPLGDNEVDDVEHKMFIVADAKTLFVADDGARYRGVFFMLDPEDEDDTLPSDFAQGKMIDHAIETLNGITSTSVSPDMNVQSRSTNDNLVDLASAYKVYFEMTHTLTKSDYQKSSKAKDKQTNVYSFEYDIWNVYSLSEHRNYYLVHQEIHCNFSPCYKDIYSGAVKTNGCKTMAKVCEWYGDRVSINTKINGDSIRIHRDTPETTASSTSYTSGFSWSLGGLVGFVGSAMEGSINAGISCSSSESYSINDITVSNLTMPGQAAVWNFDLKGASASFNPFKVAGTTMNEGALSGRTTFKGGTDFIFSCTKKGDNKPTLSSDVEVTLRRTCGKCGSKCHEDTKTKKQCNTIELPYLTDDNFK